LSCAWQSAERQQSYTSTSLGQFRYCRCLQKEISVVDAYAHFGAMQQTEQTYGDVGWSNAAAAARRVSRRELPLMLQSPPSSIESKASWTVATVALVTMLMAFGAAWITAVALKDIAAEVDGIRSIPALASALAWLGSGFGGILMGRIADKVGTRWTVICGSLMIGLGLAISTIGPPWPLWIGHGLFIGLIGLGGINAPMYIYVSRWFDRRRGSALALISSGSYLAGAMWPPVFERAIAAFGWRSTMLWYALAEIVVIIPLALLYFRAPPELVLPAASSDPAAAKARVLGWPPNLVFGMMCVAAVLCCVPMAMPQGHLVAFCSDIGITRSNGALMLSVLLGTAFLSRQMWGAISDRIGGLATVLIGSAWQAASMTAFLFTQNEAGLFTIAAAFGLGFSGIIPAYVLALRELFPASEASWRIPTLLLFSGGGMALGGWLAGLLYDHFGYYAPAFAAGIGANILNLVLIGILVGRGRLRAALA
jgi:MFS family permease